MDCRLFAFLFAALSLASAADVASILPREYQAALDSDDACASSDCALPLLQLRAASSRQPAEQIFAERIREAVAVVPESLVASQTKGAPPGAPAWPAKPAPMPKARGPKDRHVPRAHAARSLPWVAAAAEGPTAEEPANKGEDVLGHEEEANGETTTGTSIGADEEESLLLPSPLVSATSVPAAAQRAPGAPATPTALATPASPLSSVAPVAAKSMPAVREPERLAGSQVQSALAAPGAGEEEVSAMISRAPLVVPAAPVTPGASVVSVTPLSSVVPAAQVSQVSPRVGQPQELNVSVSSPIVPPTAEVALVSHADQQPAQTHGSEYDHPTWLHSCTKVMLDLGTGHGDHVRMMYEPEMYTKSNLLFVIQQIFENPDKRKLPGNESGICVLGLEPNAEYQAALEDLRQNYQAYGWNVHFYPFGAWGSSGTKELQFQDAQASGEGGASLAGPAVSVRMVDMVDFVNSFPHSFGVRMMIMDMDGAEYETLAHLLEANAMCQSIIKSALISAHEDGDVTRWANPDVSRYVGRSFKDIKERVGLQHCNGKSTPVMDLDLYGVPLPR